MDEDRCELLCLDLPRAEELRLRVLKPEAAEAAAKRGHALGDPTRLSLGAALLEGGELCGCDLSWIAERSQNLVSHHLRCLREAGLATSRRDGKMVFYRLTPIGRRLVESLLAEQPTPAEASR